MTGVQPYLFTLRQLLDLTGGTLHGEAPADTASFRLSTPEDAAQDAVVIAWNAEGVETAVKSGAGLLVLSEKFVELAGDVPALLVPDARLALAGLAAGIVATREPPPAGIHPTAVIDDTAEVHPTASVGPHVSVAAGARIGAGSVLGAGCSIGGRSTVGENCRLYAGVHVYHDVQVGNRVILHSGVVLGADGFGYGPGPAGPRKIEHLGGVTIGDDVEIGANSAVDRGTLGHTSIGARSKLDNLVQVGHNVKVGSDCLIAGQCAIGGSSVIGNGVTLAGNAAISDHVVIEDGATIGGLSGVSKRVPAGEVWFGIPAVPHRSFARRQYLLGRLEEIWKFVRGARPK